MSKEMFIGTIVPAGVIRKNKSSLRARFSICLQLNHNNDALQKDHPGYEKYIKTLFRSLPDLIDVLKPKTKVSVTLSEINGTNRTPLTATIVEDTFRGCDIVRGVNDTYITELWSDLLGLKKSLQMESFLKTDRTISKIESIASSLKFLNTISNKQISAFETGATSGFFANVIATATARSGTNLQQALTKVSKTSAAFLKSGLADRQDFFVRSYKKMLKDKLIGPAFVRYRTASRAGDTKAAASVAEEVYALESMLLNTYAKNYIDIDDIFNTFSQVKKHPLPARLLRLTADIEIDIPSTFLPTVLNVEKQFLISFSLGQPATEWRFLGTQLQLLNIRDKYAVLVKSLNGFFSYSIMKENDVKLLTFDPVSKEQQLTDMAARVNDNEDVTAESHDAFTRGILYQHEKLKDVIKPAEITDATTHLSEDNLMRGQRIVMFENDTNFERPISLTAYSTQLQKDNDIEILCRYSEGCIHSDHVLNSFNEEEGKLEYKTVDTIFHFSGEPVSLKSVFSKASKTTELQRRFEQESNPHDDGLFKCRERVDQYLNVDYFPFKRKVILPEHINRLRYGMAYRDRGPRLHYYHTYQFCVYNQYVNGWGLPMQTSADSHELSLLDLLPRVPRLRMIEFKPLENFKPLEVYHTKQVSNKPEDQLKDKESLDHLVIKSDSATDITFVPAKRHLIPPRTSFENAFYHKIFHPKNLSPSESFLWKCKYNCDAKDVKECEEDPKCSSYCGRTVMEEFYTADHIYPNYIPEPLYKGFTVKLYWDKACTIPVVTNEEEGSFEWPKIDQVKSYSVNVLGINSRREADLEMLDVSKELNIKLKKGAQLYAKLTATLFNNPHITERSVPNHMKDFWWTQVFSITEMRRMPPTKYTTAQDMSIRPLQLAISHAVKKPLVTPSIKRIFSSHVSTAHVPAWLAETTITDYNEAINIIGVRGDRNSVQDALGNTKVKLQLFAHFERLDIVNQSEGKFSVLNENMPTGALELWMRKEEYVDDPENAVLPSDYNQGKAVNHIPDEPARTFNVSNKPALEYKIEYNEELARQIKDPASMFRISDAASLFHDAALAAAADSDLYKDFVTEVKLFIDVKTNRFEEREYILRNVSKFRGFFSDKSDASATETELQEFMLQSKPFKVMLLNNTPPAKPLIAFPITTIAETREYYVHGGTKSSQVGNIITVYIKSPRDSSGGKERIGFFIYKEGTSYFNALKNSQYNLFAKVGLDVVSGIRPQDPGLTSMYISESNIVIPAQNDYDCRYDKTLGMFHYLPKYDPENQMWKFEIEFILRDKNGKHFHTPFIQLPFVHYQPFSHNYNTVWPITNSKLEDMKPDCRFSEFETSTWAYLLPERTIVAYFDKPNFLFDRFGEAKISMRFDPQSLNYLLRDDGKVVPRSNIIFAIEGSHDKKFWKVVKSRIKKSRNWHKIHPILSEADLLSGAFDITLEFKRRSDPSDRTSEKYSHFRIRVLEVEWFVDADWLQMSVDVESDILDNENMRVRYIELI